MKKLYILLFSASACFHQSQAQYLDVPEVIQEQNEWCWAGVSKALLGYYGYDKPQCEIADYARTVITWRDFGSEDCCDNPEGDCNYWNYSWGHPGSIQDIIRYFGSIENHGVGSALTLANVTSEIIAGRPFVVRWGWRSGGGHFVIGHGVEGANVSYMDPWFGEGHHVASYSWLKDDGNHTWTHTNVITTSLGYEDINTNDVLTIDIYPNPAYSEIYIQCAESIRMVKVFNALGVLVETVEIERGDKVVTVPVSLYAPGLYLLEVQTDDKRQNVKFIKE